MKTIAFLLFISITSIIADSFPPSPYCSKPYKPYSFSSQWEVDSFNNDVERYKNCIQSFIDEQNNAIRNHRNAADNAISEWNNFVNYELN